MEFLWKSMSHLDQTAVDFWQEFFKKLKLKLFKNAKAKAKRHSQNSKHSQWKQWIEDSYYHSHIVDICFYMLNQRNNGFVIHVFSAINFVFCINP